MPAIVIFFGRLVQALASSVMWVVGFSTIADNVKQEHLGKTYGIISVAVAVGTSAGPMLSGILFDLGGYWVAWSSAFVVLVADIVLRLLMLERPKDKGKKPGRSIVTYTRLLFLTTYSAFQRGRPPGSRKRASSTTTRRDTHCA